MSTTHEEPAHWLHAAHGRVSYLETTIQQYTTKVAAGDDASPADFAGIMRAGIMLTDHKAELEAWRALLTFWEEHQTRGKREIPLQVAIVAVSIYLAAVLAVLVYLVALAGR